MEQDYSARIVKFLVWAVGALVFICLTIWLASNLDLVFKPSPIPPPIDSESSPAPAEPPKALVPPPSQSRMMVLPTKDDSVAPEKAAAEAQQQKAAAAKKKNWRKSLGGSLEKVNIYNQAP